MSKALFIRAFIVFFLFSLPPIGFSVYQGNLLDALIIGMILLGILFVLAFGFIRTPSNE
ncbi:hypothetical protein [Pontibacillus chungwhensis]|uniref:hypothetical protein n=1 Tax=Pontibacillus chungwhensis TaxID=265426 RepID=UPI000A5D8DA1|nr:hypothetical protein [Pontibacillus chungwhensis]